MANDADVRRNKDKLLTLDFKSSIGDMTHDQNKGIQNNFTQEKSIFFLKTMHLTWLSSAGGSQMLPSPVCVIFSLEQMFRLGNEWEELNPRPDSNPGTSALSLLDEVDRRSTTSLNMTEERRRPPMLGGDRRQLMDFWKQSDQDSSVSMRSNSS